MLDKYKRLASVPVGELRGYKFHLDNLTRIKKLRGHEVIGRVAHALGLREVRLAVRANNRGVGAGHINAVLLAGAAHAGLGENADDIQGLALFSESDSALFIALTTSLRVSASVGWIEE